MQNMLLYYSLRWLLNIRNGKRQKLDSDEHAQSRHSTYPAIPQFKVYDESELDLTSYQPLAAHFQTKPTYQVQWKG
jgi:hypothetical protein